jgi:hypothetical protein
VSVAQVRWVAGGTAEILSMGADKITLRSTSPSPPGSRLEGAVTSARVFTLRVKIHGCRREPDGAFMLEGRPIDLTREDREQIARACAEPEEGQA